MVFIDMAAAFLRRDKQSLWRDQNAFDAATSAALSGVSALMAKPLRQFPCKSHRGIRYHRQEWAIRTIPTLTERKPTPLGWQQYRIVQSSEELLKFRPDNAMLFTFLQQALTQHDTTKVCIGLQSLQNVTIQRFAGQSRFLIAETPAILLFFASNHVCERELIGTSCAGSKLICGIR